MTADIFHRPAPMALYAEFLPYQDHAALLEWTLINQAHFTATAIGVPGRRRVDSDIRSSQKLNAQALSPWRDRLERRFTAIVPDIAIELGLAPIDIARIELEMSCHNHGDFYRRHRDVPPRPTGRPTIRALSMVYYFHAQPKAFSGGALRLYAPDSTTTFVDVEPRQNTLVAFLPRTPHEVRPIDCPSRRFADSRFAINCWVHQTNPAEPQFQS